MLVEISNDGQRIVGTNYWDTELAARGMLYLAINAGAFRLLVPPAVAGQVVPELGGARQAVVSRGPWPAAQRNDAVEVLLDDGSQSPWSCHLDAGQVDRMPLDSDASRPWTLSVWVRGEDGAPSCVLELPCEYRRSQRLPDLRPARRRGGGTT